MLRSTPESIGRTLIFVGWGILLLYLPSGLLHHLAGAYVYLRDILLGLHLFASLIYLSKNGQLNSLLSKAWLLGILPLFLLPALFLTDSRVEMGGYIKWSIIWLDCVVIGRLISQHFTWNLAAKILSISTAAILLADFGTGFYEWKSGIFVIPMRNQLSPMGVILGKDHFLAKDVMRIKGLQRDVFSFANLMGMCIISGMCFFLCMENPRVKVGAGIWACLFSFMLYHSGGRSAFFGVGAAGMVGGGLFFAPEIVRRQFSKIALGWLAIGLLLSFIGIGDFTDWFSRHFMKNSHIGDSSSAYMRDDNWQGVRTAIAGVPVVLFTGSPLGSLIDSHVAVIYHWADNNYLWILYHGSFISLAALIFYFRNVLARPIPSSRLWSKDCLLLFLLYVMGEAIARESLAFLGCIPLFIACGYVNGIRLVSPGFVRARETTEVISQGKLASLAVVRSIETSAETSKPSTKSRRKRSDSDSFAERVARRTKKNQPSEPPKSPEA